jgi:NCS1 family nucleobase:cation symporter-1
LSFIDTFGSFFGPIFGVMVVDYYMIKECNLSNKDIYSVENESTYFYSKGWHIKAIYSLLLGFIFSASTIWNVNLMFLQSYAWIIGALVSATTYYLLAKK